jgi:hypothetical protein
LSAFVRASWTIRYADSSSPTGTESAAGSTRESGHRAARVEPSRQAGECDRQDPGRRLVDGDPDQGASRTRHDYKRRHREREGTARAERK